MHHVASMFWNVFTMYLWQILCERTEYRCQDGGLLAGWGVGVTPFYFFRLCSHRQIIMHSDVSAVLSVWSYMCMCTQCGHNRTCQCMCSFENRKWLLIMYSYILLLCSQIYYTIVLYCWHVHIKLHFLRPLLKVHSRSSSLAAHMMVHFRVTVAENFLRLSWSAAHSGILYRAIHDWPVTWQQHVQ